MNISVMQINLIGAGDFCQEISEYLYCCTKNKSEKLKLFLFDSHFFPTWSESLSHCQFLGCPYDPSNKKSLLDRKSLICYGDTKKRQEIDSLLSGISATLDTFMHETASVAPSAKILPGVIILPNTVVSSDTVIGRNVVLNSNCSIGHHVSIGKNSVISPNCVIAGRANIGHGSFVGSSSVMTPKSEIGEKSVVMAGSTVYRKHGHYAFLSGTPAKNMKKEP